MRRRFLLGVLLCGSVACQPGEPVAAPQQAGAEQTWVARHYHTLSTYRNMKTNSCYIVVRQHVYGGRSVAITAAKQNADCE